jgi:GT2 family glycosyltransferase
MEHIQELDHDVIVLDDCSDDGTQEYLSQIRVETLLKDERKGLTDSWNWAYKYWKMSKEYSHLVLMNNDVLVPKGAIENMLSDYPLVVPMCNPGGGGYVCQQQEIDTNLKEDQIQFCQNTQTAQDSFIIAKCWTGFMMCFSRAITEYEREDGYLFDPANINTGNDDDLASRVRAYIALGSFVYHFKGTSFNKQIGGRNDLSRDYR